MSGADERNKEKQGAYSNNEFCGEFAHKDSFSRAKGETENFENRSLLISPDLKQKENNGLFVAKRI